VPVNLLYFMRLSLLVEFYWVYFYIYDI
jgi:hypothetical protein